MPRRDTRPYRDPFDPFHPVVAQLDLHGLGAEEAGRVVAGFLRSWSRRGKGNVVHVITGRGRGSPGRPVLPGVVKRVLAGECAALVDRWQKDENEGGVLVRLK
jgi:DNA-nicking Smr family endonuclease